MLLNINQKLLAILVFGKPLRPFRNYTQEIFSHRGAGDTGENIRGKPCPDAGLHGMHHGYRPGRSRIRKRQKRPAGSVHREGNGAGHEAAHADPGVERESGLYPDHARHAGISAPGDLPDHQRGGCDRRGRPAGQGPEEKLRGSGEPGGRQRRGFPRAADEHVKCGGKTHIFVINRNVHT